MGSRAQPGTDPRPAGARGRAGRDGVGRPNAARAAVACPWRRYPHPRGEFALPARPGRLLLAAIAQCRPSRAGPWDARPNIWRTKGKEMTNIPAILCEGLTKQYGDTLAL